MNVQGWSFQPIDRINYNLLLISHAHASQVWTAENAVTSAHKVRALYAGLSRSANLLIPTHIEIVFRDEMLGTYWDFTGLLLGLYGTTVIAGRRDVNIVTIMLAVSQTDGLHVYRLTISDNAKPLFEEYDLTGVYIDFEGV